MTILLRDRIHAKLLTLYGEDRAAAILTGIQDIVDLRRPVPVRSFPLSESDVILITYGDMVRRAGEPPLATLHQLLKQTIRSEINSVHILPFYPYSSDDGFSVIDFYAVNPELGDWGDIRALGQDFHLMFDAVFNHVSARSDWFQAYLRMELAYDDYFISVDPQTDLSQVRRPRALPLLTRFETAGGERHVWTTFGEDQIDLNVANPDVLLDLIRVLLFYVEQGAALIRLDAIAFLWKEIGTSCIHLPQTHLVIQLMRDILDAVAPDVVLVTETNVPHDENISYFGDGENEAQMVYQFSLPPLTLHTFRTGDTEHLSHWAASLRRAGDLTSFFNFTASHDGIGVTPARGILSDADIDALIRLAEDHGGFVSYKANGDGSRSPYELNISYFDAITDPRITAQDPETACKRFLCSQAIMLALMGVPGVYFHSLFGSRNDLDGVKATERYRSINREKLDAGAVMGELADRSSIRHRVFEGYRRLLRARVGEPLFHPLGSQQVHKLHPGVFALERISPDGAQRLLALHNVRGETIHVALPAGFRRWRNLIDGVEDTATSITLWPYQVSWLKARS
ncbi:MAG: sugar phosphorylase [Anaerolineae bacterium]|nr:sugar phosphorylase [Anaerolineae bacterium]